MTPVVKRWAGLEGDDQDRLATARSLARRPDPDAKRALELALAREKVPWTRKAIEEALAAVQIVAAVRDNDVVLPVRPPELEQLRADAIQETALALLHRITPLVGRARSAAARELNDESELLGELEALHSVCRAIRGLSDATGVPQFEEIDLGKVISKCADAEFQSSGLPISAAGTRPFFVNTDLGLFRLAFDAVLRNATEATAQVATTGAKVTINWGNDSEGVWIAVIDQGPGLPDGIDVYEIRQSSKSDSSGFGLPTAREAMRSLGGSLELRTEAVGTSAILRLGQL